MTHVDNGTDGLWHAVENVWDLVLLDIMLPGMNGFKVCDEVRKADVWTPILMLTAKDGELDEAEALDTGADDYLTKPFSFPVLVAHMRALLRRTTGGRPAPLEAGSLRIDPLAHRCWRNDAEINLTAREFAVLELLVRNGGAVVTKSDILRGVWEHDFDGDPNIVEVYIRHIRRKIDDDFGTDSITTIRGAGYRMENPDMNAPAATAT